jgi:hypothetical protein
LRLARRFGLTLSLSACFGFSLRLTLGLGACGGGLSLRPLRRLTLRSLRRDDALPSETLGLGAFGDLRDG